MEELFILDDPAYLSGGAATYGTNSSYASDPSAFHVGTRTRVDTAKVVKVMAERGFGPCQVKQAVEVLGQAVRSGRFDYHHRPEANRFLEADDEYPSIGVELETERKSNGAPATICSNWFHFERDGSLGDGGYECITDPLPSRAYREVAFWCGLQDLLSRHCLSWDDQRTGLHVHVGVANFTRMARSRGLKSLPFDVQRNDATTAAMLGKHLMAYVYQVLAPRTLIDRVFLRANSGYCGNTYVSGGRNSAFRPGGGDRAASDIVASMVVDAGCVWMVREARVGLRAANTALLYPDRAADMFLTDAPSASLNRPSCLSGHHSELNADPAHTFEFRRGKGTLNGVSIHRMVEFCAGVEQYAERIAGDPALVPSSRGFIEFIVNTTTSEALKADAAKALGEDKACA